MMRTAMLGMILALAGLAQESDAPKRFAAADLHASPVGTRWSGLYLHGDRMELHGATLIQILTYAYGVKAERIFGGPNWLDTTRFEILAVSTGKLNQDTGREMLKNLLTDRLGLEAHMADKPEPIYSLVPGKKLNLKSSTGEGEPKCDRANRDGYLHLDCQHITMESLAERLMGSAQNYFDHPTVDKTGAKGTYDFSLQWTGRGQLGAGDADHPGISLFDALEKQYGIKVEPGTRPASSLVIDKVNATPAPNPPGTVEKLPELQTEFEVAEVRPSKPDTKPDFRMINGRIEALGLTMKDLIGAAYNLDDYELPVADKWLETDHFDVIAKAAPDTPDGTLRAMLKTLIIQRFHLKVHTETQPVEVYALTAPRGKGKLKENASQEHGGCTRTPKDGAFVYSCRNTTMAQLALNLPNVGGAAGYFDHPMLDFTGLTGSYDFDITWSPPGRVYGAGGRGNNAAAQKGGGVGEAGNPMGGFTIFEAIDKQLNLKLALEKRPIPVTVIDHIDRTPSEN